MSSPDVKSGELETLRRGKQRRLQTALPWTTWWAKKKTHIFFRKVLNVPLRDQTRARHHPAVTFDLLREHPPCAHQFRTISAAEASGSCAMEMTPLFNRVADSWRIAAAKPSACDQDTACSRGRSAVFSFMVGTSNIRCSRATP